VVVLPVWDVVVVVARYAEDRHDCWIVLGGKTKIYSNGGDNKDMKRR
jgi:hypothetical protein